MDLSELLINAIPEPPKLRGVALNPDAQAMPA
jgi:hypothetical protein